MKLLEVKKDERGNTSATLTKIIRMADMQPKTKPTQLRIPTIGGLAR